MEYSDNPRKVYGRVEVIYSDAEISKDIQPTESGDSEISHPEEVFGSYLVPTIKACTMDGNSTMDGTFQMMDDSVICGWWSDKLAKADGTFTNPPWLELKFLKRPILSWVILGDNKLNQYPVNFDVEYKTDGVTVKKDSIRNNTNLQIRLLPTVEDITSIRITILKWSKPKAVVKLIKFYDRLAEMYEGDAVQMFELTEEMASEDGNYNINSDTLTVSIHNTDRKFDKGYLRSLMVLDRKLKPEIGIEKDGEIVYTKLGTFYSEEWNAPQDSQWVKCNAVDRLMRLQKKTYVGMPVTQDVSLYDIAEDVLTKADLDSSQYSISEELKDVIIPTAYMPKESTWDALQEIANAGLCKVYADRNDKIVIRAEQDPMRESGIQVHKGNTFTYTSNISLTDFANRISVDYIDVEIKDEMTEACEVTVNLEPGAILDLTLDYSSDIAYGSISSDNPNVHLTDFFSGVNACTVKASNPTGIVQTAILTVVGNAIEVSTKTITLQDEDSVRNSGITEYSHPTSELVQSHEHAEYIAETLLKRMAQGEGVVTTTWRGNPELELGNEYETKDRFDDISDLMCESNKFTYDGGLKQETRGRKIIKGD